MLNENKSANSSVFIGVSFVKCTFENFGFMCTAFSNCAFEECSFINSNFSDAEINQTLFDSCLFESIISSNGYISKCQLICPQFKNINKSVATLINSKIVLNDDHSIS